MATAAVLVYTSAVCRAMNSGVNSMSKLCLFKDSDERDTYVNPLNVRYVRQIREDRDGIRIVFDKDHMIVVSGTAEEIAKALEDALAN
jgi:hypothetical protein